ncbi:phage tail protein [Paenibacillus sp. TAB 01]|uniref:phage tail-collar fiber domain-containing protein n=1 Tax=Paenibacillus sp. TAB 01 TaxID=3368988 RepID=UPI0037506AA9
MGAFGGLILTSRGRALQVKAQAGVQLHYTRIAIGDGSLGGQSISDLNALINERKSLSITKLKPLADNKATIGAVLNNQDMSSGFYFREIGVFAQDPDAGEVLYCYGNAGNNAEYIPAGGAADLLEKHIDAIVIVGNAANVTATIDQSLVLATKLELESHTHDGTPGNGPKISSTGLANAAVTDTILGNRTIDDTATPNTGPNTLTNLLSFIGNRLKNITGESNWSISPAMTIKQIFNKFLGAAAGGGHTHDGTNGNGPKIAAGNISLVDSADYYSGTDPEAALAELGDKVIKQSPPTSVSLVSGQQVITSPRVAPYNVVSIKGQTRVNLLGRAGGFESSPTGWGLFQSSTTIDTTNFTSGKQGLKIMVASGTYGAITYTINTIVGKTYVVVFDFKNGNATKIWGRIQGSAQTPDITDATKFTPAFIKFTATAASHVVEIDVGGAVGTYAYVDSVRPYEVSTVEYAALDGMNPAQVAAKYQYVDDVKPINTPYVIKCGENQIPNFFENWGMSNLGAVYEVIDGYTIKITSTGNTTESQAFSPTIMLLPNTTYTFSSGGTSGYYRLAIKDADYNNTRKLVVPAGQSLTFTTTAAEFSVILNATNSSSDNPAPDNTTAGVFTYIKPMLNLGSTALPHKPNEDDCLVFPTKLHSNIDRSVYDEITYRDGQYYKNSRFGELVLDGTLGWVARSDEPNNFRN